MEDPQPPSRAPPPLPPKGNQSSLDSDTKLNTLPTRVVNSASIEENSSSAVQADSLQNAGYHELSSESHEGPPGTTMDGPHEMQEPSHRPPPPPPKRGSSLQTPSSPVRLEALPSPEDFAGVNRVDSPRIVIPDTDGKKKSQSRQASYGSNFSTSTNDSGPAKSVPELGSPAELTAELHYHHRPLSEAYVTGESAKRSSQNLSPDPRVASCNRKSLSAISNLRPTSSYSSFDSSSRRRSGSLSRSPQAQVLYPSGAHPTRKSPDHRRSYIDLLNVPYPQQAPPTINLDNAHLRTSVGNNASLLSPLRTLEMYRANVKKTNDSAVQYSFAIFMLETAQELVHNPSKFSATEPEEKIPVPAELVKEARQILQKLADRSYPFAQYYLADGYASGLFNKGKEDNDRAFPLFVAASKHGHVEAGYRAALSYEFGWGTRKDPLKAVQFYRQSASKNHPGAMTRLARACLTGDLGLGVQYKEGIKWLKRATESADQQYNTAPYELGLLHESGYGDDVFKDEQYAAQLFTQAADLGHVDANFKLGNAYEHGKLKCPKDAALSIHFYNGAAARGHGPAMMALCAWYMVGAEPVLVRDEGEAYEWAKRAAETGLPKAQYAVGYFSEMGIGTRRDPLDANAWYVKAADQGDERAKHRLTAIHTAASGGTEEPQSFSPGRSNVKKADAGKGSTARNAEDNENGKEEAVLKDGVETKDKTKKKWGIF